MNGYALVALLSLVGRFALDLLADIANLRELRRPLSPELADLQDPATRARSAEYTRAITRHQIAARSTWLAVVLLFWFLGGFGRLDDIARSPGAGAVLTGLLYLGLLYAGSEVIYLPFRARRVFVIEGRFGFNRTTLRTFVLDRAKETLLAAAIGLPVAACFLALFTRWGAGAWIGAWAIAAPVLFFLSYVAPAWIFPLFNTYRPLAGGELREAILAYVERVRFPARQVYVVDGSRRSTHANAIFAGFGPGKRIGIFDTLIEQHRTPEIVGVLAHEVGHYVGRHVLKGTLLSIAHLGLALALFSLVVDDERLYAAFFVDTPSIHVGAVLFGFIYTPLGFVLSLLGSALSRRFEREADDFAARTTEDPAALVRALSRFARDDLANLTPHRVYVLLHYSHPPLAERLEAIRRLGSASLSRHSEADEARR